MNTNKHECDRLDEIAESAIGAAYEVSNVLGAGFLEKVYERAMVRELASRGLKVEESVGYPVAYKGQLVGKYIADIVVADAVLVELKCVDRFAGEHTARCINCLKASGLRLALLFNFQKPKVEWKRLIYG